ncbi:MAG: ImmA/IrrE family metallo-endopeptidase, partial [Bacteroidota bacterium]|nr:ImmA/IrrE family metallo-endopeptidase [Bacteroidota bacterium]
STAAPFDLSQLERVLKEEYGYTLDYTTLGQHAVATQARLRSVFQPKTRRLLLRPGLSRGQQAFVLGREVAFNYLKLTERPYVSSSLQVSSFDEVLNNFKASYFAGALLMEEESLLRDVKKVFAAKKWSPDLLLDLMTRYDVSPEMFMQRLTTLLPRHFGLQSLFFLRFDQADAEAPYELTKELHLARLHNPHGNELNEHYCRRWVSLRLLADARALPLPDTAEAPVTVAGAQKSRYFGTEDEYLCFTLARAGTPTQMALSVTVGLRCDDNLKQHVRFLADPALPFRIVNETCERCPIADCESRAAAPTEIARQAEKAAFEAAVAAVVDG